MTQKRKVPIADDQPSMVSKPDRDALELAEQAVRRTAYTVITKPLNPEKLSETVLQLRAQRISGAVRKPGLDAQN